MSATGLSQADIDAMLSSAGAEATPEPAEPMRIIAGAAEPEPASIAIMPDVDAAPAAVAVAPMRVDAAPPVSQAADPAALRSLTARVERLETSIPGIDQLWRDSRATHARAAAATAAVAGLDQRVASIEDRLRLRRAAGRSPQTRSLWSVDVYLDLPAA